MPVQNILYYPFGLRCGHQLCKNCALRCAGMATALGDPVRLLSKASLEAKCPECQQKGMFEDIMYLKQVDQLVKERSVTLPLCTIMVISKWGEAVLSQICYQDADTPIVSVINGSAAGIARCIWQQSYIRIVLVAESKQQCRAGPSVRRVCGIHCQLPDRQEDVKQGFGQLLHSFC